MAKSVAKTRAKRIVLAAVVLGIIVFAVQGGEYGTSDLVRQRTRRERLQARIDSLTRLVDSLERRNLAADPAHARVRSALRTELGNLVLEAVGLPR